MIVQFKMIYMIMSELILVLLLIPLTFFPTFSEAPKINAVIIGSHPDDGEIRRLFPMFGN